MKNIIYFFVFVILFNNITTSQTEIDTIEVTTGWNLIGAVATGNTLEIINTVPPGIIVSSFWGFNPLSGYYQTSSLDRGYGYWVMVSQSGIILTETILEGGYCEGIMTIYYEGKTYNTIEIGNQCWLRENIDVGIRINGIDNSSNNGIIEKYCFDDDSVNCIIYGGLYGWDEAMQYLTTSGAQGICPAGWHIPTAEEFYTLAGTVVNDGNSLKSIGQGTAGGGGTNSSGYTALLTGYRANSGGFNNLGNDTNFWSSTESNPTTVSGMTLVNNSNNIIFAGFTKGPGLCIRCIKD